MALDSAPPATRDPAGAPSGTVTFLFTDIEGSTRHWERDPAAMSAALRRHDALLHAAIAAHRGLVFKTVGDAFCAVFARADDALDAAVAVQHALGAADFADVDGLGVRIALHTGTADERGGDYYGTAVNRVARLLALGHGGQVLVSGITHDLVEDHLPATAVLRDLGRHRLKDLTRPEHVYQLFVPEFAREFPPLRSLQSLPNNLPLQMTSFVGRENEIAEVTLLLDTQRLVTLVGSGGIGKTRTTLHLGATLLAAYPDGVWFVELAPLTDPAQIDGAIADALGLRTPADRDRRVALLEALRSKRLLLILDNCEHLTAGTAGVAAAILRGSPGVTILASSRQGLGIAGEVTYRMPSLGVPDRGAASLRADELLRYGAIALFKERAQAANARFVFNDENAPVIAEICRRLDGISLAIELAAARVTVLAPHQLRDRLDDRFRLLTSGGRDRLPRQQTLRALIDWSYDLLDEPERALFRHVAIFVDGFTATAAGYVCAGASLDELDVLDLLGSLVDKSLVVAEFDDETTRYRLLESTRVYALEKLDEAGERGACADAHLEYFRSLMEAAERERDTTGSDDAFLALRSELENVRAALAWSRDGGSHAAGAALLAATDVFWSRLGLDAEALIQIDMMLAVHADAEPRILARLWTLLAYTAFNTARVARAYEASQRAVAFARASGDAPALSLALLRYAAAASTLRHVDDAERALDEAARCAGAAPSAMQRLRLLQGRTHVAGMRGDLDAAAHANAELRALNAALGNVNGEMAATAALAETEHARGETQRAIELVWESLPRAAENAETRALLLTNLAGYLVALGDHGAAQAAAGEAMGYYFAIDPGRPDVAFALAHLALAFALAGEGPRPARLLGYCDAVLAAAGYQRDPIELAARAQLLTLMRERVTPTELERLLAEGAALTPRQAIDEARAEP